jgi:nucleotide-binding universal stress UspA family protein
LGRAVAEVAPDEQVDLIVIGKRPHSWLADAVRGPIATHIVHDPPCPVMVVAAVA